MSGEKELTTGGSEVRRFDAPAGDGDVAVGSEEAHAALRAHFDRHVGAASAVLRETVSTHVRVDVHFVPPCTERPRWTLYTTGMSDRPMPPPPGTTAPTLAELVVFLPAGWKFDEQSLRDERWYWPVRQLRFLACFPHVFGTWVGVGHTLANGEPPVPFAPGCPFSGLLLLAPSSLPPEAHRVRLPAGEVQIYAMVPLTTAETELKLEKGTEALVEAFAAAGVGDVVDISRPSAVAPRKRWWQVF